MALSQIAAMGVAVGIKARNLEARRGIERLNRPFERFKKLGSRETQPQLTVFPLGNRMPGFVDNLDAERVNDIETGGV